MGGGGDALVFVVDNALSAVVGIVWSFCLPAFEGYAATAYLGSILNDAFATWVILCITYFLVDRFGHYRSRVPALHGYEEDASGQHWRTDRLLHAFHTELHVMLVAGFSVSIAGLHAKVCSNLWRMFSYHLTHGMSTDGSCVQHYAPLQVALALFVTLAFVIACVILSFKAVEERENARTMAWATVCELAALSFAYGMAWSFYNAISMTTGCLTPGAPFYFVKTQVYRAIPIIVLCLFAYYSWLPRLEALQPRDTKSFINATIIEASPFVHVRPSHTCLLLELCRKAVYILIGLSIYDIFWMPTHFFHGQHTLRWAWGFALCYSVVAVGSVYLGLFDNADGTQPARMPMKHEGDEEGEAEEEIVEEGAMSGEDGAAAITADASPLPPAQISTSSDDRHKGDTHTHMHTHTHPSPAAERTEDDGMPSERPSLVRFSEVASYISTGSTHSNGGGAGGVGKGGGGYQYQATSTIILTDPRVLLNDPRRYTNKLQRKLSSSWAKFYRRRTLELTYNLCSLLMAFSWWHCLEGSLRSLYISTRGALNYDKSPALTMLVTIATALFMTCLVALLVVILTEVHGPGRRTLVQKLPDWAKPAGEILVPPNEKTGLLDARAAGGHMNGAMSKRQPTLPRIDSV